jgi:hypothetical protein
LTHVDPKLYTKYPPKGYVLKALNISMVTIPHHNVKVVLISYLPPSNHEFLTKYTTNKLQNFLEILIFNALLLKSQVEQLKIERKAKVECISKVRLLKWKILH